METWSIPVKGYQTPTAVQSACATQYEYGHFVDLNSMSWVM